jgi:N-acetylglutamate synthase-like GNAT family acetyltransferase
MLNWCLQHADNWQLGTDPGTRAEKFYLKAGWQKKGLTKSGEQIFENQKLQVKNASENDLITIQQIAEKTCPVAYAEILSPAQMRYMLDKMYSLQALENQLEKEHKFLIAEINDEKIGFASFELNYENSGSAKLHKLYVLPEKQGLQAGNALLDEVINQSE